MYTIYPANHATAVLYITENIAHRLLPVSSAIAAMVAMHGKNSNINTKNAAAERGVKSRDAIIASGNPSSPSLLYSTPSVLTTNSFAGMLVIIPIVARQFNPIGCITGAIALPIIPMYECS